MEVTVIGYAQAAAAEAPEWVAAEMPPGYRTRLFEIQRLANDLKAMDQIGHVLWETGDALLEAVCGIFSALDCPVDAPPGGPIGVRIGESRRLLLVVSSAPGTIQKTSEELARAFQAVQYASGDDRVVLVATGDPATPPAERPDPILPDALGMLERMGVNFASTVTLFKLWRLSLEDRQKARRVLETLHGQEGGQFWVPTR
jgi:hypothetical protein